MHTGRSVASTVMVGEEEDTHTMWKKNPCVGSVSREQQWLTKEVTMTAKVILASIILVLGHVAIGVFLIESVMWAMSRLDGRIASATGRRGANLRR